MSRMEIFHENLDLNEEKKSSEQPNEDVDLATNINDMNLKDENDINVHMEDKHDKLNVDHDEMNVENEDEHLPRVQVELDKLNYANESINSLELELEESKREYLLTIQNAEDDLMLMEKKLGNCVEKSKPYYDARIELNDAKEKYAKAKIRFETAQELYVAAKRMQMYAEENLETYKLETQSMHGMEFDQIENNKNEYDHIDNPDLLKILDIAKIKVNETELAKQTSDLEQIEAYKFYEEKLIKVEELEKSLKKQIDKSRKYFETKANFCKELRFLFTKIEGLKSCLKEAKSAYQQSLKNLELISTEIHTQRQTSSLASSKKDTIKTSSHDNITAQEKNEQKLISNSSSTLSSSSSSLASVNNNNKITNNENNAVNDDINQNTSHDSPENEDFDDYFKTETKKEMKMRPNSRNNSDKINSTSILTNSHSSASGITLINMSDEELENLKLDEKFKKYKLDLTNRPLNSDEHKINSTTNESSKTSDSSLTTTNSRPQFRVPFLLGKK